MRVRLAVVIDVTAHQLRVFVAVARHGHFGRAAESLHLATSTLSENVATLERRIGRRLFDRGRSGASLTPEGVELLPLAERVVDGIDAIAAWGQRVRDTPRVRVGLMVTTPRFRAVMTEAARERPDVQWEIRQLGFDGWVAALERGDVDCAFVAEAGPLPAHLHAESLWSEGLVLVVPEAHPLAAQPSVEVADLAGETFIAVHDPTGEHAWLQTITGRDDLKTMAVAHSFEEVLELCGAGLGVNIAGASAPESFARPGLAFVPLRGVPDVTTSLCFAREQPTEVVREFGDLAHAVVEQIARA